MVNSILAGFLISLGATIYLKVGGVIGACLFSIGLLTILYFKFHLFTGKAGLLATAGIKPVELVIIWCGNLIGCFLGANLMVLAGLGEKISAPAAAIIQTRLLNTHFENFLLGIICGLLMYIAVSYYATAPWITTISVASFILLGANHCVADMVYMFIAVNNETFIPMLTAIVFSTFGNILGCNILPLACRFQSPVRNTK